MAKPGTASSDERGMTKKQLKRLERKRKKSLAEAGLLPGSFSGNLAAALDTKDAYDGDHVDDEDRGVNAGEERAKPADLDAGEVAPGGGISSEEDVDKASASFDIRNSLVGKVAEALLAKQLEEERAALPASKRTRLGSKAFVEVVPSVGESGNVKKEKNKEGKAGKKGKKEKKEKKKEKKRKKKERGSQEAPANADLDHAEVPESATRKRQRGVEASQQKFKTPVDNAEGRQTRASKKRKGEEKEEKQKTKLPKKEQPSPWPDIKYEASSARAVLRQGQSVMIDGAANVTLIAGGASVMGYRLRREEEVLVTSCGQLAPVSIIVHNGARGRNDLGVKEHENRGLTGGEDGETSRGEEAVMMFSSCWLRTSEGAGSSGGRRTFRLEPKAPGASRSFPQAPVSESRNKGNEIQLQPTIIPLAWKTVTDSVLNGASTATRAATDIAAKDRSDGLGGTGLSASDGAAEAGVSGRPPIVVICGGKNVGKSTYGRYLVNRLLDRYSAVSYLETDVGQPEFTAPGLLSLHLLTSPVFGPPSTHMRDPKTSFFYGDVSAKTDPELYLRCVVALYDEFRRNHYDGAAEGKQLPLVVNTHGWVKGLGLDVLIDILRYTVPTHVVDVQSAKANKNLPPGNFWETTIEPLSRVHYIPTAVPDQVDASTPFAHKFAPEERALRLLAHFQTATASGAPPGLAFNENDAYSALATCLVHHRPFQVRLDAVQIYHLHGYVPPEEALWALNGAVVGLAKAGAEPETGPMPRCLGIGLVRGIDPARGVLFLVTSLPLAELQGVNTLIQGKVDLPLQLLSAPPFVSPYLAFNSIAAEGTGSAMVKSRNNIIRKVGD